LLSREPQLAFLQFSAPDITLVVMDLQLRFDPWYRAYSVPFGMGPKRSGVRIDDDVMHVWMGWGFSADIPLSSITSATNDNEPGLGWGVHGWRGKWLVNGSRKGVVKLTIDPPVRARVVGANVQLRTLLVSMEDPSALIAACARV